jgi:hypothetical protein
MEIEPLPLGQSLTELSGHRVGTNCPKSNR